MFPGPVEAAQDLLARNPHPRVGGQLAEPPVDAVKHARWFERTVLDGALEPGAELQQVPPQTIHGACALGHEIAAVIEQEPDLHGLLGLTPNTP